MSVKWGSWFRGNCINFVFSCSCSSPLAAAARVFVFKCDARDGSLLHHTRFQNPALPSKGPPQCRHLRKRSGGNCFSHIKQCKPRVQKCRKMLDIWPPILCRSLRSRAQCRVSADTPLHYTLLLHILQFRGFAALWAHCHISHKF